MQTPGSRQPNRHERYILHMPANWCPHPSSAVSIYIKESAICSRSVGPFGPPKQEKGVQGTTLLPLRYTVFLGLT